VTREKSLEQNMGNKRGGAVRFSVVIPLCNEEENLGELHSRLTRVLVDLGESYEIVFVDDGSTDGSFQILKGLHDKDGKVKVITFTRNFGQHLAMTAGFDYARGEYVILMDADLQDPPEEIPKLVAKINEGYDVVYGRRKIRHDSMFKKLTSTIYLQLLAKLTNQAISPEITSFRIMTRKVVDCTNQLRERNRFHGGLVAWLGFPYATVDVEYGERFAGKTKYSLRKMIALAIEGIISFSDIPLRMIGYFGLVVSAISFIVGIVVLVRHLVWGIPVEGYTSTVVAIFFTGGVILLVLGVIGQYISRIHIEVKNRPLYVVKDLID